MVSSIKWRKIIENNSGKPDKYFPDKGNSETEAWPPGNFIYDGSIRTILGENNEKSSIKIR